METLQQQYEMTKIKSPINGTVDEVYTKIGATAAPGYAAFRVVNYSLMKIKSDLSESYAGKVKVGDLVNISFPGSGKEIAKKITAVSQVIDPNSRSFTVDILLGNEDKMFFHPNMIAILKICDYTSPNAITIPISTVQNTESGKFVYTASTVDGKIRAEQKAIVTGMVYGNKIEILSGLNEGDELITVGFQDLSNGQLVSYESPVASK
jgi:RND family efflux transporter MFP subunit